MFVLEKNLIPLPRKVENRNAFVEIAKTAEGKFTVEVSGGSPLLLEAKNIIEKDVASKMCVRDSHGDYKITLTVNPKDEKFKEIDTDEAYYIDAGADGALLCGKSDKGAFYAAITFKQMTYTEGESLSFIRYTFFMIAHGLPQSKTYFYISKK